MSAGIIPCWDSPPQWLQVVLTVKTTEYRTKLPLLHPTSIPESCTLLAVASVLSVLRTKWRFWDFSEPCHQEHSKSGLKVFWSTGCTLQSGRASWEAKKNHLHDYHKLLRPIIKMEETCTLHFCFCDKRLWTKQLWLEMFYFISQFQGIVHHRRKFKIAGVWSIWLYHNNS